MQGPKPARAMRGALSLLLSASVWYAPPSAHAQRADDAASRLQALLTCAPGAHWPSPKERVALRKAGASILGFAGDGRVYLDDRHDDGDDEWTDMRFRFARPLTLNGIPFNVVYLERIRTGDTRDDDDVIAYAPANGDDVRTFASAHRMSTVPKPLPGEMDIVGDVGYIGDGPRAGFDAAYFAWTKPLSARQARTLHGTANNDLPKPHRFPGLHFAGVIDNAPGSFAFGCKTFGPGPSDIDGL
ncbi:hypothetical protein ACV229_19160 [Burkholderia sp. MR1-5-21]